MTQNILIEFTASAEGLNVGIDALLKLGKIDQQTADQFIKANDALKQRQLLLQGNDTALQKFIGSLNNAQKAAIGDTYSKTLTQIKTQLAATNVEAKAFYGEIIRNAQAHIIPETSQEELLAALTIIGSANQSLKEFGTTEEAVTQKTVRATTQLRNMRQELLSMEEQGVGFSKTFGLSFDELSLKAAKLQDHIGDTNQRIQQMASDTFPLQAVVGALTGVAAGFNVVSGAALLFGQNNEEVQKSILKVQAAMQLLNGLESIAALLADQSVAKTGLQVLVKKLFTKTTGEASTAIKEEAVSHLANTAAAEAEASALAALALEKEAAPATQALGALPETVSLGDNVVRSQQEIVAARLAAIESEVRQTAVEEANTIAKGQNIIATEGQATALAGETTALVAETGATEGAEVAQVALNTAMELNPLGIILGAVLLLAAAWGTYELTLGKATEGERKHKAELEAMAEAEKKAADAIAKEEGELNILLATAKDEALTMRERQTAIEEINKKYPSYLSSLSLANLYTKQSAELIAKEIDLIQKRAVAQAAQDVYIEKLKKVAEAQAEVNRINEGGIKWWDKVKGTLFDLGGALTGTSADELALKNEIDNVTDANVAASGAFNVVKTTIDGVSNAMQGGISVFENYTHQFDLFKQKVSDLKLPLITPQKAFVQEDFDKEKKAKLDAVEYELAISEKGSNAELALHRKAAQTEYDEDIKRIDAQFRTDINVSAEANEQKRIAYGKYIQIIQGLDKEARDRFFKDTIAASHAIVLQEEIAGREGSNAFFKAKADALKKAAAQATADAIDQAGVQREIAKQLELDLHNLDIEKANKALDNQKNLTQKRLDLAEKGSQDELNAEIALLEIDKNLQINNAKGNAALIDEIKTKALATQLEKIAAFNQKVRQEADNTAISDTQHRISELQLQGLKDTDAAMLDEKKKLISAEAQLEIDSIPISGITETRRLELKQAIWDKELAAKKALEDAKLQAEIDAELKSEQTRLSREKKSLDDAAKSAGAFGPARKKINDDLLKNELDNIEVLRIANLEKFKVNKDIDAYYATLKELDDKSADAQVSNANRVAEAKIAMFNFFADSISKGLGLAFEGEKRQLQQSAENNQTLLNQKLISQDEFNKRQKKIAQDSAAIEKRKAVFEIVIDFAKKMFEIQALITAAVASLNPIAAAAAASQIPFLIAQEAIALALVAAQKFKSGKIRIQGPGSETSDSIPARLSKNESVINAAATLETTTVKTNNRTVSIKNEEVLTAINEHRFADLLLNIIPQFNMPVFHAINEKRYQEVLLTMIPKFDIPEFITPVILPQMNDMPAWTDKVIAKEIYNSTVSEAPEIDYDKLADKVGKRIGKEFEKHPALQIGFDEEGMYMYLKKKYEMAAYVKKRTGYKN